MTIDKQDEMKSSIDTKEFRDLLANVQHEPNCRMDAEDIALIAHLDARLAHPAPAVSEQAPTDLSKRLRAIAAAVPKNDPALVTPKCLTDAADEIERYYGGMLAWKRTAEKKDADWSAERMARVNERCAARAAVSEQALPAFSIARYSDTQQRGVIVLFERRVTDDELESVRASLQRASSAPVNLREKYIKDMEDTLSQIAALVGVDTDADALIAAIRNLTTPASASSAPEYCMDDRDLARRILVFMGRATTGSNEPGADPLADRLAEKLAGWVERGCASSAPADSATAASAGVQHRIRSWGGNEITLASLLESLHSYSRIMPGAEGRAKWAMREAAAYIEAHRAPATSTATPASAQPADALLGLRLVHELSRISMSLAADLVQGATYTFQGIDYLDRNAVCERVVQWRAQWDATAPDRDALAAQAKAVGAQPAAAQDDEAEHPALIAAMDGILTPSGWAKWHAGKDFTFDSETCREVFRAGQEAQPVAAAPARWREWAQEAIRLFSSARTAMNWPVVESHLLDMEKSGERLLAAPAAPVAQSGDDAMIADAVREAKVHGVMPHSATTVSIGRAVLAAERRRAAPVAQDEMLRIGAQMANTMYNLAQRAGEVIDSDLASKFDVMRKGWDAAVRAPAAPVAQGEASAGGLTVWEGPMPESNGRKNYTAVLHRKGSKGFDVFTDGFQFARSEYPDRTRYEADFMRWLIGERATKPELWDDCYDMDKHSGYASPAAAVAPPVAADDALEQLMVEHRIAVTPEHEGGFHALVYRDQDQPQATGYGATPREAINAAMSAQQGQVQEQCESAGAAGDAPAVERDRSEGDPHD